MACEEAEASEEAKTSAGELEQSKVQVLILEADLRLLVEGLAERPSPLRHLAREHLESVRLARRKAVSDGASRVTSNPLWVCGGPAHWV